MSDLKYVFLEACNVQYCFSISDFFAVVYWVFYSQQTYEPKSNMYWPKSIILSIKDIVVSLAQLSGVKLPSTAFDTQLPWFSRTLLAPTVRHL